MTDAQHAPVAATAVSNALRRAVANDRTRIATAQARLQAQRIGLQARLSELDVATPAACATSWLARAATVGSPIAGDRATSCTPRSSAMQHTSPGRRGDSRADAMAVASRGDQIARIYSEHADELRAYVASITRTDPETIEDACSHAWTQLLSHPTIELGSPRNGTLRWLTTTAAREAWRLHKLRGVAARADIDAWTEHPGSATPSAESVALLRARIDLVRELPERPRRFLLRHMLGYTYDEIATIEGVSWRTTERQLARVRRLLRDLQARQNAD
jgi:DNA-directed RNA polymerase specialized sigma24 family protein